MSPPAASLPPHPCCERDNRLSAAASILLSMSHEEPPQPDGETSDEQHNSSDVANASRKGQPWSEEEHLAFLQGLRALGKGNWRAISRQYLPSRSPTQIASHAQKHFMRVAGATKRKSRFTALETVEVGAPVKPVHASESGQSAQEYQHRKEQQTTSQPPTYACASAPFPAMPFPFMHPMMFGFPGPFLPPFMCPPPAFAAAALGAMSKQGPMPMMIPPPPMFPMAAAMAAMNPFFMAQQMAAAAQAAAAANAAAAAAAADAATSGGGTTAGTGPTATTDTANSDEVPLRQTHSAVPGSPVICKPEAHHARPAAAAAADPAAARGGAAPCGASGNSPLTGTASGAFGGGGVDGPARDGPRRAAGSCAAEHAPLLRMAPRPAAPGRPDEGGSSFHASTHSAFRPPQEVKTESQGAADRAGAPSAR
ncbi:hypothetical protein PLESTF_001605000 [Pleodorina starrii]|nr:hypothetical protein PLESTF_001605000 [Pleodorina starrii]